MKYVFDSDRYFEEILREYLFWCRMVREIRRDHKSTDWKNDVSSKDRRALVSRLYGLLKSQCPVSLSQQIKMELIGVARKAEREWYDRATSKEQYLTQLLQKSADLDRVYRSHTSQASTAH